MSENSEVIALFNRAVSITTERDESLAAFKEDMAEIKERVESAGADWSAFKVLVAEHTMGEDKLRKKREQEEVTDALRHTLGMAV